MISDGLLWLWLASSTFGMSLALFAALEAHRDLRALERQGLDGIARAAARQRRVSLLLVAAILALWALAGALALVAAGPVDVGLLIISNGLVVLHILGELRTGLAIRRTMQPDLSRSTRHRDDG